MFIRWSSMVVQWSLGSVAQCPLLIAPLMLGRGHCISSRALEAIQIQLRLDTGVAGTASGRRTNHRHRCAPGNNEWISKYMIHVRRQIIFCAAKPWSRHRAMSMNVPKQTSKYMIRKCFKIPWRAAKGRKKEAKPK